MQYFYTCYEAAAFWVNWQSPIETVEDRKKLSSLLEVHFTILAQAVACGDLPAISSDKDESRVKHADLRDWMVKHYPSEKPAFLFPELNQEPKEMVITDTSLLLVISALLKLLKNVKHSQENVAQDASAILGAKFSDSQLTKIFAAANKALANRAATKGNNTK